jgi:hypothetical protein
MRAVFHRHNQRPLVARNREVRSLVNLSGKLVQQGQRQLADLGSRQRRITQLD